MTATTPVLPMPAWCSIPSAARRSQTILRGAMLLEPELGMHVQVAAQRREFGVPAADVRDGIGP